MLDQGSPVRTIRRRWVEPMKSRGALAHAGSTMSTTEVGVEVREGSNTVGSPVSMRLFNSGADTAVSIEREVVSGHAYAILAPQIAEGVGCGYDKPTSLSVDGVFGPITPGPGASRAGALVMERYVYGPTRRHVRRR
jgi:hypothetical protein